MVEVAMTLGRQLQKDESVLLSGLLVSTSYRRVPGLGFYGWDLRFPGLGLSPLFYIEVSTAPTPYHAFGC